MSEMAFSGIYPAIFTPFNEAGGIDGEAPVRMVDFHLENGIDGFYVGGATGEGLLQSVAERSEVIRVVTQHVAGRAVVIAHIGALSTRDAVALAKQAVASELTTVADSEGADACFIRAPSLDNLLSEGVEVNLLLRSTRMTKAP